MRFSTVLWFCNLVLQQTKHFATLKPYNEHPLPKNYAPLNPHVYSHACYPPKSLHRHPPHAPPLLRSLQTPLFIHFQTTVVSHSRAAMPQFPSHQAQPKEIQAQVPASLLPRPGRSQAGSFQWPAIRFPVQLHGEQPKGAAHRAQGAQVFSLWAGPARPEMDRGVCASRGPHCGELRGSGGPQVGGTEENEERDDSRETP